ncbi:unnamed protein product [Caenorhabditis nigoni]
MGMIITSKITRAYVMFFGFVDVVPNEFSDDNQGFRVTVNSIYEVLVYGPSLLGDLIGSPSGAVILMKILAIANYFPEIYLPLLFILDTVRVREIMKKLLCSKNRASDRGAPLNVGNVP